MLDEREALKGAQEAVGDDKVIEVAIAFPVGTTRKQAGAYGEGDAVGAVAGVLGKLGPLGMANAAAGAGSIAGLINQRRMEEEEPAASIVLALTDTKLYLLGRHKLGPLASFKNLTVMEALDRASLTVDFEPAGVTKHLILNDSETGETFTYEVKPLGSGVAQLVKDLDQGQ
ncbi:hypothetical protein U6G28_09495 [Actinomycetaceae bacterium MB13-C1-2]|nr:hypothetical protein U6G28_09495 [Actinomycetaceae bacterium MB13-C1-2]